MNKKDYDQMVSDVMREQGRRGGNVTRAKLGHEGYVKLGMRTLKKKGPLHFKKMADLRWKNRQPVDKSKKLTKTGTT